MTGVFRRHSMMFASFLFGAWIFIVWRFAGMPSPGFLGRLLPAAWVIAGVLSGRACPGKWFTPAVFLFTIASWFWMTVEPGWLFAAAAAAAGLFAWGMEVSVRRRYGAAAAVIPVLFLVLFTAEANSDEVRFAEISAEISGINSENYGEKHLRTGDISGEADHHTPVFPALIAPGLLFGDRGLRIIPALLTLAAVFLLGKVAGPKAAVAGALLYPGFSTLGLAMTGWLAAGLFSVSLLMDGGKKHQLVRLLLILFLLALKMRYSGLAAGMLVAEYACMKPVKARWRVLVFTAAGLILFLLVDRFVLNGAVFWTRYGNIEMLRLIKVNLFNRPLQTLANAGWSLADPEAGLLFRAPWAVAALFGLGKLAGRSPELFKRAVIPSVFYWCALIVWAGTSWHGLPAPSGRVFVPLVPMLALGIREVWNRNHTKLLLAVSMVFSACALVYPHGRTNYADGTDSLLEMAGAHTGFSMVRTEGFGICLVLLLPLSLLFLMKRGKWSAGFTALVLFAGSLAVGISGDVYEAEDLKGMNVQGALPYPGNPDPVERYFWYGSRELLLEMSQSEHIISFFHVTSQDTLFIQASSIGGYLVADGDTVTVATEVMDIPIDYRYIAQKQEYLSAAPENLTLREFRIPLNASTAGTLTVVHGGGEPVYIDRIGIL